MVQLRDLVKLGSAGQPLSAAPPQPSREPLAAGILSPEEPSHPAPSFAAPNATPSLATVTQPHIAFALYEELLSACERCIGEVRKGRPFELEHIPALVERLIERMDAGDAELLRLATTERVEFSLAAHGVNVAILTVHVGIDLRLSQTRLRDLALAGLLNDIGMVKYEHWLANPGPLTAEQRNEIQQHPVWGYRLLEQCKDLPDPVRELVLHEHERVDGSGYPHQFAGAHIHEDAQLLGLLDFYEALTHDRPHRPKMIPSEAMRVVMQEHRASFRRDLLRALLRAVPIYPVDTWVQLNTGHIARVIATRRENPLSPTVILQHHRDGSPLPNPETVDLTRDARFSIVRGVEDPVSAAQHV